MQQQRHRRRLTRSLLLAAAFAPVPALAEVTFQPSLDSRLVTNYSSDLSPATRSWDELGVGLQAGITKQRVDLDLRYRYGRRLALSGDVNDDSRHTGSGLLHTDLIHDWLSFDAQGTATMLNTSFAGQIDPNGDDPTQQQTFSLSAQPALRHRFGRILASLRYSYGIFDVAGRADPLRVGAPPPPGQSSFTAGASDTRNQSASFTLGNAGRSDRLRWRFLSEYQRDRIEQLDQRYTSKRVSLDGEYSVSSDIGLIAQLGYEDILDRQDSLLVDPLGTPVLDANGFVQRDPANPVNVTFDESGLTYEAGFRYSPSRRTNLIVRAGRRFGDFTASGSLEMRLRRGVQLFATYSESINNFGRLFTTLFTDPVSGLVVPISSFAGGGQRTPIGTSSCAAGFDPVTGTCRFNLTQVASNATFKDQSAALTIARAAAGAEQGGTALRFTGSVSGFFTRRSYLGKQPAGVPATATPFSLAGSTDVSYGINAQAEQKLGRDSRVSFDLRAQRNRYGLSRDAKDLLLTAQVSYDTAVSRSLSLFATLFGSRRTVDGGTSSAPTDRLALPERTSATATIGLRYLFAPNRGRGSHSSARPDTPEG